MESREPIQSSATRVFAAYGFRHATFEEMAAGAGVARTLLADTSLTIASAHLEAACRILIGGFATSHGLAVASGVMS
jgi:hypothetical protein